MEEVAVADLEAELGCLEAQESDAPPRRDHGSSDTFFYPPRPSTSRLKDPSKTRSVFPFGDNGTLAWTTQAGELLSAVSCIQNRLIGVDCKKSLERGDGYRQRGKTMEKAASSRQGLGYGIGVSLESNPETSDVSWVHNRWPRYSYRAAPLDIQLQYYIDSASQSIVQQYQIRNDSREDAFMPYVINSDICFREHGKILGKIYPIPASQSPERLILFHNSQVVVRNASAKRQMKMAVFLNGVRTTSWITDPLSGEVDQISDNDDPVQTNVLLQQAETKLRNSILDKKPLSGWEYMDLSYDYSMLFYEKPMREPCSGFEMFRDMLLVPAQSTQELCAVIQLSDLPLHKAEISEMSPKSSVPSAGLSSLSTSTRDTADIWDSQDNLVESIMGLSAVDTSDPAQKRHVSDFLDKHVSFGQTLTKLNHLGDACFHFTVACFIAEAFFKEEQVPLNNARFEYAKFLDDHGWHSIALTKLVKEILPDLSREIPKGEDFAALWMKVLARLASMCARRKNYLDAEYWYKEALRVFSRGSVEHAYCLQGVAYMQVYQGKHTDADKNYERLLEEISMSSLQRRTLLSNRAFIRRRKGHFQEALSFYEKALQEWGSCSQVTASRSQLPHSGFTEPTSDAPYTMYELYPLSGVFACLVRLHSNPEKNPRISDYNVSYIDANSCLSPLAYHELPFEDPLHFAIARHLETILSVCSIPVKGETGNIGMALVDGDPLNCAYDGRTAYFQFRFLIQCLGYFDAVNHPIDSRILIVNRILKTCRKHLIWVFSIVDSTHTWESCYSVGGTNRSLGTNYDAKFQLDRNTEPHSRATQDPEGEYSSKSRAVEGGFQFLKLYLFLCTWKEEWQFVLELLKSKIEGWFSYLKRTQHMANLWVEKEEWETFRPHDTIPGDGDYIRGLYPHYHLSDSALLWLALLYLEKLIKLIEYELDAQPQRKDVDVERKMFVRKCFDSFQDTLSSNKIRSNILKTFTISKADANMGLLNSEDVSRAPASIASGHHSSTSIYYSDSRSNLADQSLQVRSPSSAGTINERNDQVVVLERSISQYFLAAEATDFAAVEASLIGIFEGSEDQVESAWRETLKMQKDSDISTFQDPRRVALTLFASQFQYKLARTHGKLEDVARKRLVTALYDSGIFASTTIGEAPGPTDGNEGAIATYETMSLLLGGLYNECREMIPFHSRQGQRQQRPDAYTKLMKRPRPQHRVAVITPYSVNPMSSSNQKDVYDTAFLPDWMYHYPNFIHKRQLSIDVENAIKQLDSYSSLQPAITKWNKSRRFDIEGDRQIPFEPAIFDSGTKRRPSALDTSTERKITRRSYFDREEFWKRLLGPRLPEQAKKRLIELSSLDKQSLLICWLTAAEPERPFFMDFLRRHESSENMFGERASWQGNIWETELHLGFYQVVVQRKSDDDLTIFQDVPGQQSQTKVLSPSAILQGHEMRPVSLSFRFVGDLRDRFWTCHFLSSVTRGFRGLVDESAKSSESPEKMYAEKQGQRKLLELVYVERALNEVRGSIDKIIATFETELQETLDPHRESFEFIHDHASRPLKAMNLLSSVSQQLDLSISAIEQWEKREDSRGLRSRWSCKDQERYGEKLRELTQKCKSNVQQLRSQQSRLRDQRRAAEQRHSDLVSYRQLQEARRSTRSAYDVRLFTYVTIIFLPLTFSSSLFSMAGQPNGSTIAVMATTTVIALTMTFLLLSNMKSLDRNWGFWVDKLNIHTRKRMNRSEHAQTWSKISSELEETTKRRLETQSTGSRLMRETNWYYFLFWLSWILTMPNFHVREGLRVWQSPSNSSIRPLHLIDKVLLALAFAPICIAIFSIQTLIMQIVDLLHLLWLAAYRLAEKIFRPLRRGQPVSMQDLPWQWLESPPRPIQMYTKQFYSTAANVPRPKATPSINGTNIITEESESHDDRHMILSKPAAMASLLEKFERKWNFQSKTSTKVGETVKDESKGASNREVEEV